MILIKYWERFLLIISLPVYLVMGMIAGLAYWFDDWDGTKK